MCPKAAALRAFLEFDVLFKDPSTLVCNAAFPPVALARQGTELSLTWLREMLFHHNWAACLRVCRKC